MNLLYTGKFPSVVLTIGLCILDFVSAKNTSHTSWSTLRKHSAREKTRDLWYHGYNNYMEHAFPYDELSPLSCTGLGPDWKNPHNIARNDVNGNFSLTLIDVLDTLVVLDDRSGFEKAVRDVIDHVSFDVDTKPQVFETTIRVLGGLLSGHTFASKVGHKFFLPWYKGELLTLAHDLGTRLLPAFDTPTGIPYARINLRRGITKGESQESCTAGGGSLILEFGVLSRLTGDERFEKAAYKAFFALWNRRSSVGLVGNTINTFTGAWTQPQIASIGAGIDSFYEYALKWYILSGDVEFMDVWDDSYAAIMRYARATDGFWFHKVNIHSGQVSYSTIDSLSAFWPGLQVLAGDVSNAIKSHLLYWHIWKRHSGLPEVWDISFRMATSMQYPLRPEFIESTWYLYRATKDPFYLDVGERILNDIIYRARVGCGLAGIKDLKSNARDDRMESFALSETLKYLFLLFDEDNEIHGDESNYVFTTEGHILSLDRKYLKPMPDARRKMRGIERPQCPTYRPFLAFEKAQSGLVQGIRAHPYYDYSRTQIGTHAPDGLEQEVWSAYGYCEKPKFELFSYDFVLSPDGSHVPEDVQPSAEKMHAVKEGYLIEDVTGIRTHIVRRLDGNGYDITKLGPYPIRSGQLVLVNDSKLNLGQPASAMAKTKKADVTLRLSVRPNVEMSIPGNVGYEDVETFVTAQASHFGEDLGEELGEETEVFRDPTNEFGCDAYSEAWMREEDEEIVLLVRRGECTFLEKLVRAREVGARGVIVISDEDMAINPTADEDELERAGSLAGVGLVVVKKSEAEALWELIDFTETESMTLMVMATAKTAVIPEEVRKDLSRVLYLNGQPLMNTRLLV